MNDKKKDRLEAELSLFKKAYGRKKPGGMGEPNDRKYDRKLLNKMNSMSPEELDELMNGNNDGPRMVNRRQMPKP
jgi:hypothetical protein